MFAHPSWLVSARGILSVRAAPVKVAGEPLGNGILQVSGDRLDLVVLRRLADRYGKYVREQLREIQNVPQLGVHLRHQSRTQISQLPTER